MEGKWEDLYRQHLYLYVYYYSLFFVVLLLVDCLGNRKWRGSGSSCTVKTPLPLCILLLSVFLLFFHLWIAWVTGNGGEVGGSVPPAPASCRGEVWTRGGRERQSAQGTNVSLILHFKTKFLAIFHWNRTVYPTAVTNIASEHFCAFEASRLVNLLKLT